MADKQKLRLGTLLVQKGIITDDQLNEALTMQRKLRRHLGDCLVEMGYATETDIVNVLETQLKISRIDLRGIRIDPEIIGLVSGSVLRKHSVLPIAYDEGQSNTLILAMADPLDMVAQDDISIITNCVIEPRIATLGEINAVLDRYFGTDEAMSAAEKYAKEREGQLQQLEAAAEEQQTELNNAPIVQLVRSIIEQAVRQRASDIHFDALEKNVRVRYRIDGVLSEKMMYDINLLPAIVTRIKIMGGMDISEKRKPQDGRITMNGRPYGVRHPRLGAALLLRREDRHASGLRQRPDPHQERAGHAGLGAEKIRAHPRQPQRHPAGDGPHGLR
jgi:type IV pilus assembly protein PilB